MSAANLVPKEILLQLLQPQPSDGRSGFISQADLITTLEGLYEQITRVNNQLVDLPTREMYLAATHAAESVIAGLDRMYHGLLDETGQPITPNILELRDLLVQFSFTGRVREVVFPGDTVNDPTVTAVREIVAKYRGAMPFPWADESVDINGNRYWWNGLSLERYSAGALPNPVDALAIKPNDQLFLFEEIDFLTLDNLPARIFSLGARGDETTWTAATSGAEFRVFGITDRQRSAVMHWAPGGSKGGKFVNGPTP